MRPEFFDMVRRSYDELSLAPVNSAGLDQTRCHGFLGDIIGNLSLTRQAIIMIPVVIHRVAAVATRLVR